MTHRILITPGEPAGIGPDIAIMIAQQSWRDELIVVGDHTLLLERAKQLNLPLTLVNVDLQKTATPTPSGELKIIPVPLNANNNANYVIRCLEIATDYCLTDKTDAMVTGPVHKGFINEANIPFTGHTEFLAERCKIDLAIMLFVVDHLKVALATTHIPLSAVPAAITTEKLITLVRLLHYELQNKFGITAPSIIVCGLNPHAGENGYLGREEIEIIEPALTVLRAENINVIGPLPADTVFTEKQLQKADAVLAMYHDQALPVVKYIGFSHAVNVTLGLPIIRTSVDHGTALDIAGTGRADAGSLLAAIQLAIQLVNHKQDTLS